MALYFAVAFKMECKYLNNGIIDEHRYFVCMVRFVI